MIAKYLYTSLAIFITVCFGTLLLKNVQANETEPACISPRNTNSILCRGN